MLIRVNGPTPTVRVRLTLLTKKRKTQSVFTTAVETGKVVQVRGFKIGKSVRAIKVGVHL